MDVIRHHDKCVELVVACMTILLQRLKKSIGVGCNLK
jgi:hypothetical protein